MYEALRRGEEKDGALYFRLEPNPRCPHCGTPFSIEDTESWHLYDKNEGEHEITCGSCDLPFVVQVNCSFSFSTDEVDDE